VWWLVRVRRAELLRQRPSAGIGDEELLGRRSLALTVVLIQLTAARIDDASRPAGASRNHDTRRLHAIAAGSWARPSNGPGGYKKDAAPPGRRLE
jgi:hypothetical protein